MRFRSWWLAWALCSILARDPSFAQIFQDDFESGTLWHWSLLPGGAAPRAVCTPPFEPVEMTGAFVVGVDGGTLCDEAGLRAGVEQALAQGHGKVRFDCGPDPVTIVLASELAVNASLTLDGGGKVTLSGGGTTRILAFRPPFNASPMPVLTLQNLTLRHGSTAHLSGGSIANGGAAVFKDRFGHLRVFDSLFLDNVGPSSGQDVAGGAIYAFGEGTTTIVRSRFVGNRCSSGGAIGGLGVTSSFVLEVYNSLLERNQATGTGGNPGNGGNGGGVYLDGASQSVTLCGTLVSANTANARGAGLFRVSNNGVGPMTIDRSAILWNSSPPGPDSQAGGLYLQGLQTTIQGATVAHNAASHTGGLFVWTNPGTQTLQMTNSTVAHNLARTGLGAGMSVASGVTGFLQHVTIAKNHNEGAASFASALAGGQGLTISNNLIADNSKVFTWENTSCNATHAVTPGGGGSFQWPEFNAGGQAELPCAALTTFQPILPGPLAWQGGPTPTIAPGAAGLAGGSANGCPAADQRGTPRQAPCTPGAVELP